MPNVSTSASFVHHAPAHEVDREACFCDPSEHAASWAPEPRTTRLIGLVRALGRMAAQRSLCAQDRRDALQMARTALRLAWRALHAWQSDLLFADEGDLCSAAGMAIADVSEQLAAESAVLEQLDRELAGPALAKTRALREVRADRKVA